jgi:hypothetical protein
MWSFARVPVTARQSEIKRLAMQKSKFIRRNHPENLQTIHYSLYHPRTFQ